MKLSGETKNFLRYACTLRLMETSFKSLKDNKKPCMSSAREEYYNPSQQPPSDVIVIDASIDLDRKRQ